MMKLSLIFVVVWVLILAFMLIHNEIVFKNRRKVIDAIYSYNMEHTYDEWISYDLIEPYIKSSFRFWDFEYKRIVPEDVYLKIKEYIK